MDGALYILTLVTALGCGTMAGVFFAFSTFVMKGLGRLPAAQGLAAMQSINVAAITPAFMTALFGTAVACVALAVSALFNLHEPFAAHLLAGSALYVVGTIVLTITYHVPRNDALAKSSRRAPARRPTGIGISQIGRRGTTSAARLLLLQRPRSASGCMLVEPQHE